MPEERRVQRQDTPRGRDLFSLRDAMNRMIDETFWDPFDMPARAGGRPAVSDLTQRALYPKVDIEEDDQNITVKANVPGVDPNNVDVNVEEDTLTLSGKIEREEDKSDEEQQYYHYEREYGEFRRDIPLPSNVSPDDAKATFKSGVLTVTLPKSSQDTRKKIEIENQESS